MEEPKPDQSAENATDEDVALPDEELKPGEIKSYADAKAVVIDGIDKLRNASADDIKQTGLRVVNRIHGAWRKLVDGG